MNQKLIDAIPETVNVKGNFAEYDITLNDELVLKPFYSTRIVNHSENFSWGYNGSGPSQLSLAILMEYMPVKWALQLYMLFKFDVVALWPQEDIDINLNLRSIVKNLLEKL